MTREIHMRHRANSASARIAGALVLASLAIVGLAVSGCAKKASPAGAAVKSGTSAAKDTSASAGVLAPPPAGSLYHGVYPGGKTGEEDDITAASTDEYEAAVGHKVAWVYFSNNWYKSAAFPSATCQWIAARGSVPYIRLMLRSNIDPGSVEPTFTLDRIIKGEFDPQLKAWAKEAASFGKPVMAEYGPEVNGDWFPWNGSYNGADKTTGFGDPKKADGPERFVAAYRHIIDVMREQKAYNVSWVFHVDVYGSPEDPWNNMAAYYPGDGYIDWLALSAYGAQDSADDGGQSFRELVDAGYPQLAKVSSTKPIIVAEMGTDVRNTLTDPAAWSKTALTDMFAKRWPRMAGFCWWDERWANDDDPANDSDMRVQDSPAVTKVFRDVLGADASRLIERPVVAKRSVAR
jgi:Glycosyl hydrolase family 26